MVDDSEKPDVRDYLPVLHLWAREQFLRICAAIAEAKTDAEKEVGFSLLEARAQSLTAIMIGIEVTQQALQCDDCINDQIEEHEDRIVEQAGQLGVAKDLFVTLLQEASTPEPIRAAIQEWIRDLDESVGTTEAASGQSDDSAN